MKHRWAVLLSILFLFPFGQEAWGQLSFYGYAGTANPTADYSGAIAAAGIQVNTGTVDFPEVWTATNLGAITASFQSRGMKTGLFLDHVLFLSTADATSPCFVPLNGGLVQGRQRLRNNWQTRLANFVMTNGAHISTAKTAFLVIHAEVNNACVDLGQLQTAASTVKSYFPGIPTVMGYGQTYVFGTGHVSRPAPASFPSAIDWIGLWAYGYFDLEDPNSIHNANRITGQGPNFYNPANRFDTTTIWGDLLSKLQTHQKVLFVMDGHFETALHGFLGWERWFLRYVAQNTYDWATKQPEVIGLLPFLWSSPDTDNSDGSVFLGTADLPQGVRDDHAVIGNAIVP